MNDRWSPSSQAPALHPLMEPSLFYDPPYQRPLDDEFAWHLVKYLDPAAALAYQHRVNTPCGPLWVDFVVEHGARRIAFEIGDPYDGEDTHRLRDALLIGTGAVDVLYRLRADDVLNRLHDVLLLVSRADPALFSARGHANLSALASPAAHALHPRPDDALLRVTYPAVADDDVYDDEPFTWPERQGATLVMRRWSRAHAAAWLRDFDEAQARFGITPEQLGEGWARSA